MRACIFSNDDSVVFQSPINAFIADEKAVGIKYQSMTLALRFTNGVPSKTTIVDCALITYEE